MQMPVDQTRGDRLPGQSDDLCSGPDVVPHRPDVADCQNPVPAHSERLGHGLTGVHRDHAADDDAVGGNKIQRLYLLWCGEVVIESYSIIYQITATLTQQEADTVSNERHAGRPSKPVLTRERILQAAFRLAKDRTPQQFTLTALAQSLGVRPSALYHHFDGRAAVIRAMRAALTSEINGELLLDEPLAEGLRSWAHSYRDALLWAPGAIPLLAVLPIDADELSFAQYETLTSRLENDGWPTHCVVHAIVAIESFIIGSALDALAPEDNMSPGIIASRFPRFAEAERVRRSSADRPADVTFDIGLRALIEGLRLWARRQEVGG
ncbi:TetR/AcrR family transcriptional regulator [Microbacterium sp. BWT-B31]|uniref:TetR/AcrR family transcriptional regulator n=1 Tax=Microbacterium sp. BWT-B31 TaxID=3232072 RepID=UPI003529046E